MFIALLLALIGFVEGARQEGVRRKMRKITPGIGTLISASGAEGIQCPAHVMIESAL